jgi:asparagine synthase (glutamine-hydrolysing)
MSGQLRHRGPDGERSCVDGAIGFACQHLWVTPEDHGICQPLVGDSGAMLVMDGRIDNRDELIDALALERRIADARCALAAYEKWGERFAEHLNGDFAAAVFDPRTRQLFLARDALGVRPLYYVRTPHVVAFASEIKALLAHPRISPRPNPEGIADLMLVGSRPLDRQDLTCFEGVSSVVPAHVVQATPRGFASRRYWDFDTQTRIRYHSFEEYVEAFGDRFRDAVKRRIRSKSAVAMSVSGGLDSSSVFCQAEALRRTGGSPVPSIHGISYVSTRIETDEQRYLGDIEDAFAVAVDRFPIEPRTGLVDGVIEQIAAVEAPFVDYMWGVTRELHVRAAASGARSLLTGHWGDQLLFSTAYLIDLLGRGSWRDIWRHTQEYARYFGAAETGVYRRRLLLDAMRHFVPRQLAAPLKRLRLRVVDRRRLKPWFTDAFLDGALRHRHRLATFDHCFHSAHAKAVYCEARSKYQVQCMEWNTKVAARHGMDASFPFLDRDLIQFLMAIPGEVHARNGVPRVLLREAMRGILPDSIRARTWKADFTPFVNQGVRDDAAALLATLTADCVAVRLGYLDRGRLASELAKLTHCADAADGTDSWDLADTYGLEMWLRVFWGREGE